MPKVTKYARTIISKDARERQQWLEDIEANAPNLGRVLRRCIGVFGSGRPARAREILEYYSLTGDPTPKSRAKMAKQKAEHRQGNKEE